MMDHNCIFCKIAHGLLPTQLLYEDEQMVAFADIHPITKTHVLLIPKQHIASLFEAQTEHEALLGRMLLLAPKLAQVHQCESGFRIQINTGKGGGQEVFHLHLHIMGGGKL